MSRLRRNRDWGGAGRSEDTFSLCRCSSSGSHAPSPFSAAKSGISPPLFDEASRRLRVGSSRGGLPSCDRKSSACDVPSPVRLNTQRKHTVIEEYRSLISNVWTSTQANIAPSSVDGVPQRIHGLHRSQCAALEPQMSPTIPSSTAALYICTGYPDSRGDMR